MAVYDPEIHPELKTIWENLKEQAQPYTEAVDQAYEGVKQSLQKRAATPGSISGVAPKVVGGVMEAVMPNPIKDPTGAAMAIFPAFTELSFAKNIATGLVNRNMRLTEAGAKRLRTLAHEIDRSFVESLIKPIEGPEIHDLFEQSWRYRAGRMHQGEAGDVIYTAPKIFYPPEHLKHGLESGTIEGYLSQKSGGLHEVSHEAEDRIPDKIWREAWGIPKRQDLYNYPFPVDSSITDRAVKDLEDIWRYSEETGLFLPSYMRKDFRNPRWNYWLYQDNPNSRLLAEAAADRGMLIGLGAEPDQIFRNLLVDPSLMNDQNTFRMNDIRRFAEQYRKQSPITLKGKPYGWLLGR